MPSRTAILSAIASRVRVVFFVTSILVVALIFGWTDLSLTILDIDNYIVESYISQYQDQLDDCYRGLKIDKALGISKLENFLLALKDVKKLDRLSEQKYDAFNILTKTLLQENLKSRALDHVHEWIAFDDKDLFAQVRLATVLLAYKSRKSEAELQTQHLFNLSSAIKGVSFQYMILLLNEKRFKELVEAMTLYVDGQEATVKRHWWVLAAVNTDLGINQIIWPVPGITESKKLSLNFSLSPHCSFMRIELPKYASIQFSSPQLSRLSPRPYKSLSLNSLKPYLEKMSLSRKELVSAGEESSFFGFTIPAGYVTNSVSSWRFSGDILVRFNEEFIGAFSSETSSIVEAMIKETGHTLLLKSFLGSMNSVKND